MATAASTTRVFRRSTDRQISSHHWEKVAVFLIVGYLCASRSFAYLGLPWIRLYVGEMALAALLLFGPKTQQGSWLRGAFHTPGLRRFRLLLLLLLGYGVFAALHGVSSGYPAFTAARDTAFNYYPLFLFLGIWVGLRDRAFLPRVLRALAWWNGCYGLAYVLFLDRLSWTMPGTSSAASAVPLFGGPLGSAIALLGLIAFEPRLERVWYLIPLNTFVLLGVQLRAEWLSYLVGAFVFTWCTKQVKRLLIAGAILVVMVGVMYLAHIDLPSPPGRGGRISAGSFAARVVAPINPKLASHLALPKAATHPSGTATHPSDTAAHPSDAAPHPSEAAPHPSEAAPHPSDTATQFSDTAKWRLVWWVSIWKAAHSHASHALLGFGYGYPIGNLNPFIAPGTFIQTPHNVFFYALAYSGWIGVVLFCLLQIELLRSLWRGYQISGQPFGLMCWAALLTRSMFQDFFEAPFGAIPFYLLVGVALAPSLLGAGISPPNEGALPIPPRSVTAEL